MLRPNLGMTNIYRSCFIGMAISVLLSAANGQSDWTSRETLTGDFLSSVAYSDSIGKFVIVGENGTILSSEDGIIWSPDASGTGRSLRSVIYGNGIFVAVGEAGTILTSIDGVTWVSRSSGAMLFISGVTYGAGRFVAVGGSGTVLTSTDAISWTPAVSGTGRFLQSVTYAAGKFVAVGSNGTIRTSTDGQAWVGATSGTPLILTAATYFDGRWLVAGQSGILLSSVDAIAWTSESTGAFDWIRRFIDDGERILAVGDEGTLLMSFDGMLWQALDSGVLTVLAGGVYANGLFVVVGEPATMDPMDPAFGLVITSPQTSFVRWELTETLVGEGAGSVSANLIRSSPINVSADVDYTETDGSALAGLDYDAAGSSVTFVSGESVAAVEIPIFNNSELEPKEFFELSISLPGGSPLQVFGSETLEVGIVDAQDSDSDNLPDDWEVSHFGVIEIYDAQDDPDGDHNDNAREFADQTDPDSASSALYLLELVVASGIGGVDAAPQMAKYSAGESVMLSPVPGDGLGFAGWTGDISGSAVPVVLVMDRDKTVGALFSISVAGAVDADEPYLSWVTEINNGAIWHAQSGDSSDGEDAVIVNGGAPLTVAGIHTRILGPARLTFDWKLISAPGTTLSFLLDGAPQLVISNGTNWRQITLPIPAGVHELRWRYFKSAAGNSGDGGAGLDKVRFDFSYDVWANAVFAANANDPLIAGAEADPDRDGIANLLEYLMDTDPGQPSWHRMDSLSFTFNGVPALTYRIVTARSAGYEVSAEASADMSQGSWQPLTNSSNSSAIDTFFDRIMVEDTVGLANRYYRLKVAETE
jgi:hypothetical protein